MSWRDWSQKRIGIPISKPVEFWRRLGADIYSCVAPPGYDKDPAVTAAIREFDPGVIPIWRIQAWMPPGESRSISVVHHGIARYYPVPRFLRRSFHVDLPQGWEQETPNFLDCFFEEPPDHGIGPAGYLPWDWTTYEWCRRQYVVLTDETFRARLEAAAASRKRETDRWQEDLERRQADFGRFAERKLANVSAADWREYQGLVASRGRSRKPFVHVRRREVAPSPAITHRVAPGGSQSA
jgi:hypothetical protein